MIEMQAKNNQAMFKEKILCWSRGCISSTFWGDENSSLHNGGYRRDFMVEKLSLSRYGCRYVSLGKGHGLTSAGFQ